LVFVPPDRLQEALDIILRQLNIHAEVLILIFYPIGDVDFLGFFLDFQNEKRLSIFSALPMQILNIYCM
jgi:hypothetical protein